MINVRTFGQKAVYKLSSLLLSRNNIFFHWISDKDFFVKIIFYSFESKFKEYFTFFKLSNTSFLIEKHHRNYSEPLRTRCVRLHNLIFLRLPDGNMPNLLSVSFLLFEFVEVILWRILNVCHRCEDTPDESKVDGRCHLVLSFNASISVTIRRSWLEEPLNTP